VNYGQQRRAHRYYQQALAYLRRYCAAGAVLDVGGGVSMGCRYLAELPGYERTCIELPGKGGATLEDVRLILQDFTSWEPDRPYDAVLCLQVLEHVDDPTTFARKLFDCAPVGIISVPYLWPAGSCQYHRHDQIGLDKLRQWTGREPRESKVVKEDDGSTRLVAVYRGSHGLPENPQRDR